MTKKMTTNKIQNAVIRSAELSQANHCALMVYLGLELEEGFHQNFGGHVLYLTRESKHHTKQTVAGHYISRCLEIAGVQKWKELVGKTIRVDGSQMGIDGIGHIIKNNWFYPEELWDDKTKN